MQTKNYEEKGKTMKTRELDFFDDDIRQEFCDYLKQYFNYKCEAQWSCFNFISPTVTFKDDKNTSDNKITVNVGDSCTICLYNVSIDINLLKFIRYIDAFLDREYTPKKYIKEKDLQQIFSFYNKLKIAFEKDKIEAFYNAIQRAIFHQNRYYLFDRCIKEADDGAEVMQEMNRSRTLDFKITINTKTGIKSACTFSVDCYELFENKINVLDIAEKLTQLQSELERIILT